MISTSFVTTGLVLFSALLGFQAFALAPRPALPASSPSLYVVPAALLQEELRLESQKLERQLLELEAQSTKNSRRQRQGLFFLPAPPQPRKIIK